MFNLNARQCLQPLSGPYQTNINTPNLIYGSTPKAQLQDQYDTNKANGAQDCPAATPFYDGYNCIQCPPTAPLFNLQYRICMRCPEGYTYTASSTYQGCLSSGGSTLNVTPDIAKMYANIFWLSLESVFYQYLFITFRLLFTSSKVASCMIFPTRLLFLHSLYLLFC